MMLATGLVFSQENEQPKVKWMASARLQDVNGAASLGFAGMISGVDQGLLLLAGGANFPEKMPWDGGKKHYSDAIQVLQRTESGFVWNGDFSGQLPEPVAYCGSVSTPAGIVYAGGENENGPSSRAYLLKLDLSAKAVKVNPLPELPLALTNIGLTHIGNVVYAAGGDGKTGSSAGFFSLDLENPKAGWTKLPPLPLALANAVVLTQTTGQGIGIYVIGGRTKNPSGISTLRSTTFVYDVKNRLWKKAAAISDGKNALHFSAGTGLACAGHFILIMGGDTGEIFHRIENYIAQIARAKDKAEKNKLVKAKNKLSVYHKGFYRGLLLYNTLSNAWTKIAELPFPAQVTTTAVFWEGNIVIPSGEVKPGIRTPEVRLGRIE
ncbi:kelch repeat-containing protein [Pedobacter africanus]|uniref:Cyclically-permuted mutarotase family protein n=1 Tax=Pedobacter africanus TaxID=151894 RepID=A0A1W2A383_9SPHI|nr:kelch repeat-containing protein [Pedobacter africanus]SMC54891.1 cyclically-permuted mutarotase family protein [Pedobacter africanus]